jgi:anti-anti-sigma regulatory factor
LFLPIKGQSKPGCAMENLKIQISKELTSEEFSAIRDQSISALRNGAGIDFDFAGSDKVGDATILLLYQIRDFLKNKQSCCSLSGLSEELDRFFHILGLHDTFTLRSAQ